MKSIDEVIEEESPRVVTPMPVNNIMLDVPKSQPSIEEQNYESPKHVNPKTSAVYESVSIDIKC